MFDTYQLLIFARNFYLCAFESLFECVLHIACSHYFVGMYAEFDDGLSDCARYTRNDTFATHEGRSFGNFDELIGDCGIQDCDAADVEDKDAGRGFGDFLQHCRHYVLCAARVDDADEGQEKNAVPEFGYGRGHFH